jgi:hypothetical protein
VGDIKSSYELALERLKERGIESEEKPLTEEQKRRIGEVRKEYEARLAELDIMAGPELREAQSQEDLAKVEAHIAEKRASLREEMEKRIESLRRGEEG